MNSLHICFAIWMFSVYISIIKKKELWCAIGGICLVVFLALANYPAAPKELYVYCLGGVLFFVLARIFSDNMHIENELLKKRIEKEERENSLISKHIKHLSDDQDSLKKGYERSLSVLDLLKTISRNMDFNHVFTTFARYMQKTYHCGECSLFFCTDSHHCERRYSYPEQESTAEQHHTTIQIPHIVEGKTFHGTTAHFPLPLLGNYHPIVVIKNASLCDPEDMQPVLNTLYLELRNSFLYEQVKNMSIIDGLTGMYLRRYFLQNLEDELERARQKKLPCSLLMIDVDDFKQYNDTYGHLIGDHILREVAGIIHTTIRRNDFSGRYGGEEFAVFLQHTTQKGALSFAQRLRKKIASHTFSVYGIDVHITVSIGIASNRTDSLQCDQIILEADNNLYTAKKKGKDQVYPL